MDFGADNDEKQTLNSTKNPTSSPFSTFYHSTNGPSFDMPEVSFHVALHPAQIKHARKFMTNPILATMENPYNFMVGKFGKKLQR